MFPSKGKRGAVRFAKREDGANPSRTRRCNRKDIPHNATVHWNGKARAYRLIRKPEDLPFAQGDFRLAARSGNRAAMKNGIADCLAEGGPQFFYGKASMARHSIFFILGVLLIMAAGARHALDRLSLSPTPPVAPQRIVSLSPGITETLYALGLGPSVAGATRYCAWPPEAANLPRVAGFGEINYEAVLRARPDLVLLPEDRARDRLYLERLGLPVLMLDTLTVSGLLRTISLLGRSAGREIEAEALKAGLEQRLAAARDAAEGRPRPKVLFAVMRADQGTGGITEIHAVGRDGFYSELIEAAGGQNAYTGTLSFPRLSRESLVFLDPEVIIEVIPGGANPEGARRGWQELAAIRAVKNGRVFVLTEQAHTVPGPRFADTLALLSQALHPVTPAERP